MAKEKRRQKDQQSSVGASRSPATAARSPDRTPVHDPPVPGSLTAQGISSDDTFTRLRSLRNDDTDNAIRRRKAHTDDLIRVLRNLTALGVFSAATLTLVSYAGIRMGIPPVVCVTGSFSAAALLVRTFAKAFESVRPSLPDAPKDPPSTDER